MTITDVEAIELRLPEIDASRCDGTQDTLVIRVRTDEGFVGLGEADSVPAIVKACIEAPPSHAIASGLRTLLLGENPLDIERLWNKMYSATIYVGGGPMMHAMSGVDLALWDILGQVTEQPVCRLLGGIYQDRVKAYASAIMPTSPKEAANLAEALAKRGYQAMKFGWGPIGQSVDNDQKSIQAIHSAVGNSIEIMIDAGGSWKRKEALRMIDLYEQYRVLWLEEPLAASDLEGYRWLSDRSHLLISAGERESGRRQFAKLMDEGQVDIVQPDLARCGGFTEGKKIADAVLDRHKRLVPHAFKTGILQMASTHFVAGISNGWMVEYTVSDSPLARDLVKSPLTFKDGYIQGYDSVRGLGITLNEDIVARYRVS